MSVSPMTLVETLARMADSAVWPQYWHSLPEMGRGGDLRRMLRTPAEGNLRALTRDERFRYHFTGVERGGAKSGDGTSRLYRVAKTQKTSKTP